MSQHEKMVFVPGPAGEVSTELRSGPFTGRVWGESMIADDACTMNTVYFEPGARTHWHGHPQGQLLYILTGEGWVGERGAPARRVRRGDWIWTPPGTEHWHGASATAMMAHIAFTFGEPVWLEAVDDACLQDAEAHP